MLGTRVESPPQSFTRVFNKRIVHNKKYYLSLSLRHQGLDPRSRVLPVTGGDVLHIRNRSYFQPVRIEFVTLVSSG